MAAVCYTCYRPARTGYVRQSIALILALGAALCVSVVVVCTAVQTVYRPPPPSPLPFPLTRRADPLSLHLSSQELHHQVITSTSSCVPSMVLLASQPDAFTVRDRFPKPLWPVTARHREKRGSRQKVARLMPRHTERLALRQGRPLFRVFGPSLPASFVLRIVEQYPERVSVLPEEP